MMTPGGCEHSEIELAIGSALRSHVIKNALGFVVAGDAGFLISREPDTVRVPDVAFVRQPKPSRGYCPGTPDLAVEIVSPTDRVKDVEEKTQAWLGAGTKIVWVVWPDTRSVVVHRAGQPPRILNKADVITGEEVLPGFECRVGDFFSY